MFLVDVTAVQAGPGRRLRLEFSDGQTGEVCLDDIISEYDGIFQALLDDQYFAAVRVDPEIGTIVWPNGADLCPDVLYSFATRKSIVVDGTCVLN